MVSIRQKIGLFISILLILFGVGSMGYFYLHHELPITGAKMTRYSLIAGIPLGTGALWINLILMRVGKDPGDPH